MRQALVRPSAFETHAWEAAAGSTRSGRPVQGRDCSLRKVKEVH